MGQTEGVAEFITREVTDVTRPRGAFRERKELGHLPGRSGAWAGIHNVLSASRHGIAHWNEQVNRFGPVHRSAFGPFDLVIVHDAAAVNQIARNEDRLWSAAVGWRVFFAGFVGPEETMDTPVMLDGDPHKDARKLLQPAFGGAALTEYMRIARSMLEPALDEWTRSGRVSFKSAIRRLLARVAGRLFMGIDDEKEAEVLDRALADFWRSPLALIRSRTWSSTWRRGLDGYALLAERLSARVAERRKTGGVDLFGRMCQSAGDIDWVDDKALVSMFIGVMSAAFDTTSLGLTSMAHLLASHPEWQERLAAEAVRAGGEPDYATLRELTEHEWAWKETLRLLPVANALPRIALRDTELGGHRIPAGSFVNAFVSTPMHDPKYWTRPSEFDPERFSPARAEDKKSGAYMPFGAGAHTCIGAQLSSLEAKLFWMLMLSRTRIRHAGKPATRHTFTPLGCVAGPVELVLDRR